MEHTYSTSQIAGRIGIHPNTVRLYEDLHLITAPSRKGNGYRVFTDLHVDQFINARLAFQVEILQNGLRKLAVDVIKATAACDFPRALLLAAQYLAQIELEKDRAEEAIRIAESILSGSRDTTQTVPPGSRDTAQTVPPASQPSPPPEPSPALHLTRQEAADSLGITIDTLRNWELNGLLTVRRKRNGYRVYTEEDLNRLKLIRSLRCANYSLTAILRMLQALSLDPGADIRTAIDTPDDDVLTACDILLSSLAHAGKNMALIRERLYSMQKTYKLNPPLSHQP